MNAKKSWDLASVWMYEIFEYSFWMQVPESTSTHISLLLYLASPNQTAQASCMWDAACRLWLPFFSLFFLSSLVHRSEKKHNVCSFDSISGCATVHCDSSQWTIQFFWLISYVLFTWQHFALVRELRFCTNYPSLWLSAFPSEYSIFNPRQSKCIDGTSRQGK